MQNIFENAKFGDRFRTRGAVEYPIIFLSKENGVYRFMDECESILKYKAPNETPIGYPQRGDLKIVDKWIEPIDENRLAMIDKACYAHCRICDYYHCCPYEFEGCYERDEIRNAMEE